MLILKPVLLLLLVGIKVQFRVRQKIDDYAFRSSGPAPANNAVIEIDFAGLNLNRVAPEPTFKKTKSLIQPAQGAVAGAQPSWRE